MACLIVLTIVDLFNNCPRYLQFFVWQAVYFNTAVIFV